MASSTQFYNALCLIICVGLAWFSVVAKPIELPALSQRRYLSNSSHVVQDAGGGMRNEDAHYADDQPIAALVLDTSACIDHGDCTSGCMVTDAAPNLHTLTCSPPSHCSLDGESAGATYSCYTHGGKTLKYNAVPSISAGANVAPFLPVWNHEFSPAPYVADPVATALPVITGAVDTPLLPSSSAPSSIPEETVTFTAKVPQGHNGEPGGPVTTLSPEDAPAPVPGQQTVYVTMTDDWTTASPIPTAPFSTEPLSAGHPESNKTAIILGSVFGSLAVLCISIVSVDHILKLRRQKREELQECPESRGGQEHQEHHEHQESHDSISSVEDMSELLRQQQQTYGYYGTQRVASSIIVPQHMKVFPASPEPVELPTPKDETVEKERRDSH